MKRMHEIIEHRLALVGAGAGGRTFPVRVLLTFVTPGKPVCTAS